MSGILAESVVEDAALCDAVLHNVIFGELRVNYTGRVPTEVSV